ncbi:hypothetical protein HYY75_03040 [bacterium]|nr:hypothetical protein [bacterium]
MKIRLESEFHNTSAEIFFHTTNPVLIQLSGRQIRKALSEVCGIEGCDCFRDIEIFLDGKTCDVVRLDFNAEDDEIALEVSYNK